MKEKLRIYDKGNGKNFIGWTKDNSPVELLKLGGRFYLTKYKFGLGLIPQGEPLVKGKDFYFGKD